MRASDIIARLDRNARKQAEYRHIVRSDTKHGNRKRIADIYFLLKYAGMRQARVAKLMGVCRERVRQIYARTRKGQHWTICHPKKSCM